jgi:threonyl-tRNA synthetase
LPITLSLPDGSHLELKDGATGLDAARSIGRRLAEVAVAARLDGRLQDLAAPLHTGAVFEVVTAGSDEGRSVLRHSTAHLMAQAVTSLFPEAKPAIGPAIDDGFYYDFEVARPFTPEDLELIEARMGELASQDQAFVRQAVTREEALALFADQPFKKEIIESLEETEEGAGGQVTVYRNGGFVDLCRGPHVPSTGRLKAFKLQRTAGAYWRGDEHRPQLQRIYGTAWETRQQLDDYLTRLEEARRRDHRKLGAELDLFSFPPELGAGLAVWHPKGTVVRTVMEDYSRRTHQAHGYQLVSSPHIARAELWRQSGHLGFYSEAMYPIMELDGGEDYVLKPMNCPFHILIYASRGRSYRELPQRLFELGTVYRYERSGVLHGLLRTRGFTQDDSHIFCMESQIGEELQSLLDFSLMVLRDFGFEEFEADLSTRPDKFVGSLELWDRATEALGDALRRAGLDYTTAEGGGAFYGPKIDLHIRDAIGRRWQVTTIQVDFMEPENFSLEYATADNTKARPVMIHRALFGSVERFFGVLLEHYAGALPGWLSPVQALIVPVADRHSGYAAEVAARLGEEGLRAEVDLADETVGEKIRRALGQKVSAVIVVGDTDVAGGTVGVRLRGKEEERGVPLGDAASRLAEVCRAPR